MILVWYSKFSSCSLCSLRFCRAQLLKQRLQKQPCNKFGLKAMKRSVKKLQKSTPALIVRPGIYGLGKAVNPGDVFLRSGHRGIERRGQDLRLGPGLGAREERGSSSAPLRVSLAPKAPFPFPF